MKPHPSICIIDDDPVYTFVLGDLLQSLHHAGNVSIYSNGLDAFVGLKHMSKAHPEELPDVILLDLDMPIMNGWDFLKEWNAFDFKDQISLYIVSSSLDPKERELAQNNGDVKRYVEKPVNDDLLHHLEVFLEECSF